MFMKMHEVSEQQQLKKKSSVYMPNMHNLYTLTISKHWNVTTTLKTCPNTDFFQTKIFVVSGTKTFT